MSDELVIRIGTPNDLDEVMALAIAASEENGFVNPNPLKLLAEIYPALNRDHGLMGLIGKPGGKVEGVILLRMGTMWYSDQEVLEEKAIFIDPNYRSAKGGRARKLCEFAKTVADGLGIPLIIGILSNHRTEAKVRMYRRTFGVPSGAFFLYGASTVHKMEH